MSRLPLIQGAHVGLRGQHNIACLRSDERERREREMGIAPKPERPMTAKEFEAQLAAEAARKNADEWKALDESTRKRGLPRLQC